MGLTDRAAPQSREQLQRAGERFFLGAMRPQRTRHKKGWEHALLPRGRSRPSLSMGGNGQPLETTEHLSGDINLDPIFKHPTRFGSPATLRNGSIFRNAKTGPRARRRDPADMPTRDEDLGSKRLWHPDRHPEAHFPLSP